MLMEIHGAGLPARAVKRLERDAVELAHAGPAVQSANLARRALASPDEVQASFLAATVPAGSSGLTGASSPVSSCQSAVARTCQAAELFDIFDLADSDVTATALSERVASLEGRLSVLEATLLAVTMPTETKLQGSPLEPEDGAALMERDLCMR